MIIFNLPALVIMLGGFGLVHTACKAAGIVAKGPIMVIAGPFVAIADIAYRWKVGGGRWFHPSGGAHLFFIPGWVFGLGWLVNGIVYITTGQP